MTSDATGDGEDQRQSASFFFNPEQIRRAAEPPEDITRLIWMFLSLLRLREVRYAQYYRRFPRSQKTFDRDVAKLRDLGTQYGFRLSKRARGHKHKDYGLVRLDEVDDVPIRAAAEARHADTLRALCDALGAVVANDVGAYVDLSAATTDPFLRFAAPKLIAEGPVGETFYRLRAARVKRTKVRFRYPRGSKPGATATSEEREVEPHLVTYYDGRYYLVAFDRRPKTNAWRQFALDRIEGEIQERGTFVPRPVPQEYQGLDAVGLFKSGKAHDVTIALSPQIAQAVVARRWQRAQRTQLGRDGWTYITFSVHDSAEAVRWAFGFGDQARLVAPKAAVECAAALVASMARSYAAAGSFDAAAGIA